HVERAAECLLRAFVQGQREGAESLNVNSIAACLIRVGGIEVFELLVEFQEHLPKTVAVGVNDGGGFRALFSWTMLIGCHACYGVDDHGESWDTARGWPIFGLEYTGHHETNHA